MRDVVRKASAFKLRVAGDVSGGKYKSLDEAGRGNGMRGATTLSKRVKKYGHGDMPPKRIKAGITGETDEMKAARNRMREREAALASAHGLPP